jgi:ankyrin repeat protein
MAVKDNDLEIAQPLLDKGANANTGTEYEGSALTIAIKHRNTRIVQALLTKGADPIFERTPGRLS